MDRRVIQPSLFPQMRKSSLHGGDLSLGKRKVRRPIAVKAPMHLTLNSSVAGGPRSFVLPKYRNFIISILKEQSKKCGVNIYEQSINSNHLHLAVLAKSRRGLQKFFCAISGRIAQLVTGSKRGKPLLEKFWDHIPFSRIVSWGLDLKRVLAYVQRNQKEADGEAEYSPRRKISISS